MRLQLKWTQTAVWLLLVALAWSIPADAMHRHSLRVVQSPELSTLTQDGSDHCPVDRLYGVTSGARTELPLVIAPPETGAPVVPVVSRDLHVSGILSGNPSRAPPLS